MQTNDNSWKLGKVVEKSEDIMGEDEKSIWTRWIIKPFNYIANRVREFLGSRSAK